MSVIAHQDAGEMAKIRYRLLAVPNPTGGQACFGARVVAKPSSLRSIAEQMVHEGSKYAEHEIVGIAEHMVNVMIAHLREGRAVNFGSVVRLRPSIKGRFEKKSEDFDPTKHQVSIAVSAGRLLRSVLSDVSVERDEQMAVPTIDNVEVSTVEGMHLVTLDGRHLYHEPLGEHAQWFIEYAGTRQVIRPTQQKKTGRNILFALPVKTYPEGVNITLVLRTKHASGWCEYATPVIILGPTPSED